MYPTSERLGESHPTPKGTAQGIPSGPKRLSESNKRHTFDI